MLDVLEAVRTKSSLPTIGQKSMETKFKKLLKTYSNAKKKIKKKNFHWINYLTSVRPLDKLLKVPHVCYSVSLCIALSEFQNILE